MSTERVNIFMAHSPFQELMADHMVTTMAEFAAADNYLIRDSLAAKKSTYAGQWRRVINLDPPVGKSVIGSRGNCLGALERIKEISAVYERVFLFRANLEWPLNNALIGLEQDDEIKEITRCNYPEGIGSLLYVYPGFKQLLKTRIKNLLGYLFSAPYYPYKGDIMGLKGADRIYTLMPSVLEAETGQEIIKIPLLEPKERNEDENSCIFLGQNYDNYMSRREYERLCSKAASFTRNLGYRRLYYKAHHYDISGLEQKIFQENDFNVIDEKRAIEEIFLTRQYSCVVSYASSALVNLKLMLSDRVRCIACCSEDVFKLTTKYGRQYRRLFEKCGVELFDGNERL